MNTTFRYPRFLIILLSLFVCAFAYTFSTWASAQSEQDLKEITQLETLWLQSLENADGEAIDNLTSSEFVYQHPTGNTYNEADIIETFASKRITVTDFSEPDLSFHDLGNVMVSYGELQITGVLDGSPYSGKMRFVNVWEKQADGNWQLIHRNSELL
jgi:ketosteroid isomerase-like protein